MLRKDVLKHIERVWEMLGHPFIAVHVARLYTTAGELAELKRCAATISDTHDGNDRDVSLVLLSALSDFVKGDHQRPTNTLATLSLGTRIGMVATMSSGYWLR